MRAGKGHTTQTHPVLLPHDISRPQLGHVLSAVALSIFFDLPFYSFLVFDAISTVITFPAKRTDNTVTVWVASQWISQRVNGAPAKTANKSAHTFSVPLVCHFNASWDDNTVPVVPFSPAIIKFFAL